MARCYVLAVIGCLTAALIAVLLSSTICVAFEPIALSEEQETLTSVQEVRQLTLEGAGAELTFTRSSTTSRAASCLGR